MATVVAGGCAPGDGRKATLPDTEPKAEEKGPEKVFTGSGEATRHSGEANRKKRWTIRWKESQFETHEEGRVSGVMKGVTGTIFRNDRPVSDFSADRGIARKENDVLSLEGKVRMISRDPKGELICDRLDWQPDADRIEAKGNVRGTMSGWRMGVFPELWCTPDLRTVATPDLFGKDGHGSSH